MVEAIRERKYKITGSSGLSIWIDTIQEIDQLAKMLNKLIEEELTSKEVDYEKS